jgi:hypothetical protein
MRRTVLLAGVLPFISAFLGALLAINLAPRPAEAQDAHLRAEQLTLVGDNGADRIRLESGPGIATRLQLLDANGSRRVTLVTGDPATGGGNPDAMGIQLNAGDGPTLARLGTINTPTGGVAGMRLVLNDQQGIRRIHLAVAEDGTPSIELLDADGTVTWSAP